MCCVIYIFLVLCFPRKVLHFPYLKIGAFSVTCIYYAPGPPYLCLLGSSSVNNMASFRLTSFTLIDLAYTFRFQTASLKSLYQAKHKSSALLISCSIITNDYRLPCFFCLLLMNICRYHTEPNEGALRYYAREKALKTDNVELQAVNHRKPQYNTVL